MDARVYRLVRLGVLFVILAIIATVLVRNVWLGPGARSGDFCELRCMRDTACLEALRAEDLLIEPDRGLCNGLCSALRTIEAESRAERERFGLDPDSAPLHPCLRPGPLADPAPQE